MLTIQPSHRDDNGSYPPIPESMGLSIQAMCTLAAYGKYKSP